MPSHLPASQLPAQRSRGNGCRPPFESGLDLPAVLAPHHVERAITVESLIGVCAEQIAKSLDQARWALRASVAVVVGERGRERRRRYAEFGGARDHPPPWILGLLECLGKEVRKHQVREAGLVVVGLADPVEETRADDAASAPDRRHRTEIDL